MNCNSFTRLILIFVLVSVACSGKKEKHRDEGLENDQLVWKQMDNFHLVMAETFHPYNDSANLEPVKRRATELMVAANEWAGAPIPEKVNNDEIRSKLDKLKSEATTLSAIVKSADNTVIGNHLNKLHDTFHEIHEAWNGANR